MDDSNFLIGVAEVGAAFVGFSSIVRVFRPESEGPWSHTETMRFRNLVEQSLAVVLLSFLPLALLRLGFQPATAWTISSTVLAIAMGTIFVVTSRRTIRVRRAEPAAASVSMIIVGTVCFTATLALQAFNVLGVGFHREPGPYMAGLLLILTPAAGQFALLVLPRFGLRGSRA